MMKECIARVSQVCCVAAILESNVVVLYVIVVQRRVSVQSEM